MSRRALSGDPTRAMPALQPSPTDLPRVAPRLRGSATPSGWPESPGPRRDVRPARTSPGGAGREISEFDSIQRPPFAIINPDSGLAQLAKARFLGHPDLRPEGQLHCPHCPHCRAVAPCASRLIAAEVLICAGQNILAVRKGK
jgi:hypothetical protein